MSAKDEAVRCRAIAESERAEAQATTLANVREVKLRSAGRWEEMAMRNERAATGVFFKGGSG